MKKHIWLAILCAALVLVALLPFTMRAASAEGETSGQCGDDLYWEFDESTGALTITGRGDMSDFSSASNQPWASIRNQISVVEIQDRVTSIGNYAFMDCSCLLSVKIGNGVASIGEYAFSYCPWLWSITFGNNLITIGDKAFFNCTGLGSVTIPDSLISIGQHAFYRCTNLQEITVGNGVTNIGQFAFSGCTKLSSIIIPDSVESISDSVFYECTNLTDITIGNGVKYIGEDAFSDTGWWNTQNDGIIYLDSILIGVKGTCGQIIQIEDGTSLIANHAFSDRQQISSIVIPNSVTFIGDYAFSGCTGLMSVTIPDNVISIGAYAFRGCTGLTAFTIPDRVTYIDEWLLAECTGLLEIIIPDNITSISNYAFYGCTGLKSVTIGSNVKSIGNSAFSGCTGLLKITIPDNVVSIGYATFRGCSELTSVTIGDGVTNIDGDAFRNCTKLVSITMPCSASYARYTFTNCTAIATVHLTKGNGTMLTYSISSNTTNYYQYTPWFISRNNELTIILDDAIQNIGNYAFYGCAGLTSVVLGKGINSIGSYAFNGCTNLTTIQYHGTPRMKNGISIDYGNNTLTNAEWHFLSSNAIEWKMLPTKLAYREGDALDVTGGAITTYYEYDIVEEEPLTAEMVSGFDNTTAGEQILTVMFEGQTTTFSVTVSHLYGEPVHENEIVPTCTEDGQYDSVVYCTYCGEELSRETVTIAALGHAWGEPVYTWTKTEDGYAATANVVCLHDETHTLEEEGTVTYAVITEPTDQTEGLGRYTAVFTNELFAMQTYEAAIPVLVPTLYGDVNVDGRISPADAALILRTLVGLNELSIQNMLNAEVDGDGTVTAVDAAAILRYIVGLIDAFPVE